MAKFKVEVENNRFLVFEVNPFGKFRVALGSFEVKGDLLGEMSFQEALGVTSFESLPGEELLDAA